MQWRLHLLLCVLSNLRKDIRKKSECCETWPSSVCCATVCCCRHLKIGSAAAQSQSVYINKPNFLLQWVHSQPIPEAMKNLWVTTPSHSRNKTPRAPWQPNTSQSLRDKASPVWTEWLFSTTNASKELPSLENYSCGKRCYFSCKVAGELQGAQWDIVEVNTKFKNTAPSTLTDYTWPFIRSSQQSQHPHPPTARANLQGKEWWAWDKADTTMTVKHTSAEYKWGTLKTFTTRSTDPLSFACFIVHVQ